ncbi:ribosomal-processing cysteine protease Prp [Lactobacillus sp. S2-2]|uniref:ribosomal-processing cysteine protease Prp n=1 Tax=Lactobacillus sp. S2-2 TaxID=2692917 RepID=UPI001F168515|nr:ribosomal-processing cysteine protease Prp [Lactobacillus sp. S2-2]MCF6515115.1 ribosomal-processing cysteine protease Prp [Lactobacillus sp. S2-2]
MIYIKFNYNNNNILGYTLKGHANSGEYGKDIVCAGVSALAINATNSLTEIAKVIPKVVNDNEQGGFLSVELNKVDASIPEVKTILDSFKLGISEIEKEYNDYIKIKK